MMKHWILIANLFLGISVGLGIASAAETEAREIMWDELMPADWDPMAELEALMAERGLDASEDSPETYALLDEYLASGVPIVEELNGQVVKIPGYIVPLDFEETKLSEFLLVPYFGACIHVPPPPANQIVYVKSAKAREMDGLFEAVWVTGTIQTQAFDNDVGDAGYTLEATEVVPYEY